MKKVKWIVLALVLCLGLIGGAYAYWEDELHIVGTVESATWEIRFDPDTFELEYENNKDNVNGVSYTPSAAGPIEILVENASPNFKANGKVDIVNLGSVPANVYIGFNGIQEGDYPNDYGVYFTYTGESFVLEAGENNRKTIEFEFGVDGTPPKEGFETQVFRLQHIAEQIR